MTARPLRVLLVEGCENDALLLERELRGSCNALLMRRVDTPEELHDALKKPEWDVILTDHNLPGFNAESVLQWVRQAQLDIPVIIVSGGIGEEAAVKAMKAGASDCIMKDNLARLPLAIERELREAEARGRQRQAEQTMRHLAFYDPLTQLPNRRLLMDRLEQALTSSLRNGQYGALLYLDLDNFKKLNDTLGHNYGDLLLKKVAERLKSCIRKEDTVARLGGDEFVVMLESLNDQTEQTVRRTKLIGDKIVAALGRPYLLNGHRYHASCSVGVALFHGGESRLDSLFTQADTAMYAAKKAGRNTLRFFDPAMQATLNKRVNMENALRQALSNQQFELYYQLQINADNTVIGVEALIRWRHPELGLMLPAEFIPLSEEIGLISMIGQWVLETVCAQLKVWEKQPLRKHLSIAVNVSSLQFKKQYFVEDVCEIVKRHAVNPARLKLELTENLVLENVDDALVKMRRLKALGFLLSLDNFGTGYSSLNYLNRLPFNQIKIDHSFIGGMPAEVNDAFIVEMVITIGRRLGMEVIAEGVSTRAQLDFLRGLGCPAFQGYLLGKPVLYLELESQLTAHPGQAHIN